jgi:hypothetical protein
MFCPECSKLAILNTNRICVRCQGFILNNLSCICDKCSKEQNVCSICLKKIRVNSNGQNINLYKRGCRSCGK